MVLQASKAEGRYNTHFIKPRPRNAETLPDFS